MFFSQAVSVVLILLVVVIMVRLRGRKRGGVRSGPGPGASGAIYDMLNEDKRRAIELIAEGRAEATDPEHADDKPDAGGVR